MSASAGTAASAQLRVTAWPGAVPTGRVAEVIASLPVSLSPAAAGADLVAVAGAPGWTGACAQALAAGARGVVVADPVPEDTGDLLARTRESGAVVVLDARWTHNPAVADAAPLVAGLDDGDRLVELRTDVPRGADLDQVLLDALGLLRATAGPVAAARVLRRGASGDDVLARLGSGSLASLSAVVTDALPHRAVLRVVTARAVLVLELPAPVTARPGTVRVWGEDGARLLPTRWETASRAAWRRAHALVTSGGTSEDLQHFAEDAALVRGAVPAAP